jgi:RNA polymerase sigma-70 factor (ECF subfamily)
VSSRVLNPAHGSRLRAIVQEHLPFAWRTLRRLGVSTADLDDATQGVFIVVSERLEEIEPGRERAFVFGTALRIASHARRTLRRRREAPQPEPCARPDPGPNPEEITLQRNALEVFASVLNEFSEDLRRVFLLFEMEGMRLAEIAAMERIPLGTVASRLSRARTLFRERMRQRGLFERRTAS